MVLWEDEFLVVVDKPAGLLSIPDGYDQTQPHLLQVLQPTHGPLWVVHRLDRETSGVLVLARTALAHHLLNDQFAERRVNKRYHAIVYGVPDWEELQVEEALRKNGDRRHRTVIDPIRGKPASTGLHVLERYTTYALVEAHPHTGYTHQIRAQLAFIGFPILADELYGAAIPDTAQISPISRVALHALMLSFLHPITGDPLTFKAPYPQDFQNAVEFLRKRQSSGE
jgi:RluA family pseudouridine synthase